MISERIEHFWDSLFEIKKNRDSYKSEKGRILELPLERNALEQIKYAQWLYGDGLNRCKSIIKQLKYTEGSEGNFQFDYRANTFSFEKPEKFSTDDFYFLFDYLKEIYRDQHYEIIESVREFITAPDLYSEIERYVLVNTNTNHLVKIEVINNKVNPLIIIGLGYPINESTSFENSPEFFKIIQESLE